MRTRTGVGKMDKTGSLVEAFMAVDVRVGLLTAGVIMGLCGVLMGVVTANSSLKEDPLMRDLRTEQTEAGTRLVHANALLIEAKADAIARGCPVEADN